MEARVTALESIAEKNSERLASLERDVSTIRATMATGAELHKELNSQTWKMVGACAVLVAATYFIAKNIAASPLQSPPSTPTGPIVIQIPAQPGPIAPAAKRVSAP